ncbi:MAG: AMP-binding protein [Solirubrobacterales bacterium]
MNWARDVVEARDPAAIALIELARDGSRRAWGFGEVVRATWAMQARLEGLGVGRGDVVLTLVGNRPEWVIALLACFRMGAMVLPCTEQLREKDLRLRLAVTAPKAAVVDARNLAELEACEPGCPLVVIPDADLFAAEVAPPPAAELDPEDGCLLTFTSGTEGSPKAVVHVQRYLTGQAVQAEHWFGPRPGDVAWCTAAAGWSKSARNAFIAPWLRGATAVLHDGRFDPAERLEILAAERVNALCMAPTEYRLIAKRATIGELPHLRRLVAAGEALNPEVLDVWRAATGLEIADGFGQTETGQLTGVPLGEPARPGSMGRPLPGMRVWVDDGELVVDPETVPTFFRGYLGHEPAPRDRPWRTGDRVREEDGWLYFEGRADDVIVSSGYRIGPFEVESALVSHPAVTEAAVVGLADAERGEIVRAVVVLGDGVEGDAELRRALQEHVKATTAPYKYPRRVEFVAELPKTASGKIQRALLRRQGEAAGAS